MSYLVCAMTTEARNHAEMKEVAVSSLHYYQGRKSIKNSSFWGQTFSLYSLGVFTFFSFSGGHIFEILRKNFLVEKKVGGFLSH